jgi:hypothetical protein
VARTLSSRYSSLASFDDALDHKNKAEFPPAPLSANVSSTSDEEEDERSGDESLARSCRFMYETLLSRIMTRSASNGNVGVVYEAFKVSRY